MGCDAGRKKIILSSMTVIIDSISCLINVTDNFGKVKSKVRPRTGHERPEGGVEL